MDSDGDDESQMPSTLDPTFTDFAPGDRSLDSTLDSSAPGSEGGSSLIFGRGGDFLSKYSGVQRELDTGKPRSRKKAEAAPPPRTGHAPDRMHVQLNSLLVHSRTVDKILQVVEAHFDSFNAVNLITALHRLATIAVAARKGALRRDARFKRLKHRLSDTLRNADTGVLKPQDLSNVAWALTKLGLLNAVLCGHLSEHIMRTIAEFEPVNLSMTLWAFARSGFLDEKLFRAAATEVKRQLPDFQPQQIANTIWAMAKSGFVDEELFLAAASLTIEKLDEFQPMNFSMLLYSFALAKVPHPQLFEEVGKRCTVSALSKATSSPHIVTNLALAFSDAGVINGEVFDALALTASDALSDFRCQQISTLMRAFARAGVKHDKLFKKVSEAVVLRLAEFEQPDLQDLLAAFQSLGLSTSDIGRAIQISNTPRKESDLKMRSFAAIFVVAILVVLYCLRLRTH